MIVLGIDPSYTSTGYAVVSHRAGKQFLLHYGYFSLGSNASMSERVSCFFNTINQCIIDFKITCITLETPFLGKNAQTFLKLGYLRGICYLLAAQHNITIFEFSPREIKKAVTGFGAAEKTQVSFMIQRLFPALEIIKSHDVTDAIAIALCGVWTVRF